jgi:hypothetical protein
LREKKSASNTNASAWLGCCNINPLICGANPMLSQCRRKDLSLDTPVLLDAVGIASETWLDRMNTTSALWGFRNCFIEFP